MRPSTSTAMRTLGGSTGAPPETKVTRDEGSRPCVVTSGAPCGSSASFTSSAALSSPPELPRRSSTSPSRLLPCSAARALSWPSALRNSAEAVDEKALSLTYPHAEPLPSGASAASETAGTSTCLRWSVARRAGAPGASPSRENSMSTCEPGSPRSSPIARSRLPPDTFSPPIEMRWSPTRSPAS